MGTIFFKTDLTSPRTNRPLQCLNCSFFPFGLDTQWISLYTLLSQMTVVWLACALRFQGIRLAEEDTLVHCGESPLTLLVPTVSVGTCTLTALRSKRRLAARLERPGRHSHAVAQFTWIFNKNRLLLLIYFGQHSQFLLIRNEN